MSISFTGWSRKGTWLWLDGHTDVYVAFEGSNMEGKPFCASVGNAMGNFASLTEAISWAHETALARDTLNSADPLPTDTQLVDQTFLQQRGLAP
jgi:hypothetical protein